jgi:hypothetical protein
VILLEFAAQGIRGVAPAGGRATLRPGYNVVAADGAALRRLLEAMLYPDPRDGETLPRAPGQPAGAVPRAGLTLVGNDRITYRLVRDFAAAAQLHRFDPEKRSFSLVSQELAEIRAFLQKAVGVPPPSRLSALLALSAAELPSKAGGGGLTGASALQVPARTALTAEQARRRLDALRGELDRARISEKLQAELDALHPQGQDLDETFRAGAKLREGLERAEQGRAELDTAAGVVKALGEADARLTAYERAEGKHAEAESKIAAERQALDDAETAGRPAPFWKDPLFWAGAGGGIAAAAVGLGGAPFVPGLRYLALVDLPAFGWAAWVAFGWVGALERWDRVSRRRRVVDDWEKKVTAQWEKDAGDVRAALAALDLKRPAELRELLGRLADADAVVTEWRRRVDDWEASPEALRAAEERVRLEEQRAGLEARLAAEAGGFVRDVRSVETEIQRLEAELAAPPPPPSNAAPPRAAVTGATEPIRGLLERAAAELGGSVAGIGRGAAAKASQVLTGLTFQRLTAVQVDDRGGVHVVTGGKPVPALTLAPVDRDVVFLALKLALLEQALSAGKLVAVVDDAFGGLSDGGRRFAARLLKQAARPGQLLHATADAAFREAADHSA